MEQRTPTGNRSHAPRRDGGLEDTLLRETIGDEASRSRVEEVDALPRGAMVGRYVVLEHIGAGGMGVVYAAYDPDLDRRVALKVLRASLDDDDQGEQARARLLREGQAMARVRHPSVIAVHDVGTHERRVFIAMEFIDGCTLTDWLEGQDRPRERILDVFRAAGRGLAAAHRQGLIHRDFKPDNVLTGHDGRVCVVDFGLARRESNGIVGTDTVLGDEDSTGDRGSEPDSLGSRTDSLSMSITRTGMLLGTPAYMAPEQHLGLLPGPAADQFAFCVGLYEALYGERPFRGNSPAELLINVTEAEVQPSPQNARVPQWIRRVLLRGLSRRPRDRWPDMEALLEALERPPDVRRRRWAGFAAVVLVLGGSGAGVWSATQSDARRCDAQAHAWDGLWDAPTQARYAAAFSATGMAFAPDTWQAVQRNADSYVTAWTEARTQACAATHEHDEQSPEVLTLREACFDDSREQFAAIMELFTQADGPVVAGAVDAVLALPPVQRCAAAVVLRAEARLPDNPRLRAEVSAQRHTLDRVITLYQAHRLGAARALVDGVLARARTLGVVTLEAEALLARADIEEADGNLDEAQASTHTALLMAEQANDDRLAATAWVNLLWIDGYRRSKPEAGHAAADHARALIARWPDAQELEVLLESRLGDLLYAEGRYAESLTQHRTTLALRDQLGPSDDPRRGDALTGMGLCELELGHYDPALEHLRNAEQIYRETYGAGHPHTAAALTNVGMAHDFRDEPQLARHSHELALAVAEAAHGPSHPAVAEILNNYASVLVTLEQYEAARQAFSRARDIWVQHYGPAHPDLAIVAFNLGQVASSQGHPAEARELHERARRLREQALGEDHPDVAHSLLALAELDLADDARDRAQRRLERALLIRQAAFGADSEDANAVRERLQALSALASARP